MFIISLSTPPSTASEDACPNTRSEISQRARRRIVVDTDPGLDDAFALIWLLGGHSKGLFAIEALTTTEGNNSPFDVFRNAVHIVNLTQPTRESQPANQFDQIRIAPMHRDVERSTVDDREDIFGRDGLNGLSAFFKGFPDVFSSTKRIKQRMSTSKFSADVLIDVLSSNPGQISLLAIAPLTNLFRAEQQRPGILSKAKDVFIMGGVFGRGNVDAFREFNFDFDREAVAGVFQALTNTTKRGPNVFVMPLDITRRLQWTMKDAEMLYALLCADKQREIEMSRKKDSQCTRASLLFCFLEQATQRQVVAHSERGIGQYMEMHDPAVVGLLLYPHLFSLKHVHCEVQDGVIHYDQTMTASKAKIPNCMVVVDVDEEKFIRVFARDLLELLNTL